MPGCQQPDFSTQVNEMVDQTGSENDSAFEFFREISIRCRFFDLRIESNGHSPVVITGKFADHQLRHLRRRLPVDVMVMVVRKVTADRIKIAPAPFDVTFYPPIIKRDEVNEIFDRFWLRINGDFSRGFDQPPVFDETEGKSRDQNKSDQWIDSSFFKTSADAHLRKYFRGDNREVGDLRRLADIPATMLFGHNDSNRESRDA